MADGARERATESPAVLRAVADALRDWLDLLGEPPARRLVLTRDDEGTYRGEGWLAVDARAFRAFVALAASAPVPDAGGGDERGQAVTLARRILDMIVGRGDYSLADTHAVADVLFGAIFLREPAAPPVPDDAAMPEDVLESALRAANESEFTPYTAAAEVAYRAGLAARRPAGVEAGGATCFLCGDPCPGEVTYASAAHDRCREVYGEGLRDGASEDPRCSACGCRSSDHGDEDGEGVTCPHHCTGYFVVPAADPPRPAGVDREALQAAVHRALHRVTGEQTYCPGISACLEADRATDLAAALAPLLGVTGGGE